MWTKTSNSVDEPEKHDESGPQHPTGKRFRVIARRARNAIILTLRIIELASKVYEHLSPHLGG
ncbi:MAG: hypothetical protein Q4G21_05970 [Dermabacter sp.]|nr:hypothetical protein [Dermabacter sp.]